MQLKGKRNISRNVGLVLLLLFSIASQAVHQSTNGQGQVVLVPYYTVNNQLNTLVEVTNNSDQAKAIKVNIREGLNGYAALSYNVYLDAYDSWIFALIPIESDAPGFEGQPTAAQVTMDNSCAPFLLRYKEDFLSDHLNDGPQNLARVREGFIEIIEMGGVATGDSLATAIDMGGIGIPTSCVTVEGYWEGFNEWVGPDLVAASGGLSAEAAVVNVGEGINFPIPTVALADFWATGEWRHTSPDDTSLSLDAAEAKAFIFNQGQGHHFSFERGIDAVSAVLMTEQVYAKYDISRGINAQTELIFTFPTRRFYWLDSLADSPPFNQSDAAVLNCSENFYSGVNLDLEKFDRESLQDIDPGNGGVVTPPTIYPAVCGTTFITSIMDPSDPPRSPSITGSENYNQIFSLLSYGATESGYLEIGFRETQPLTATAINSAQIYELSGLPVLGFTLQQYTNSGAQAGLLAQYGGSQAVNVKRVIAVVNETE
ncbi:MAG: hypothetical protein ACSHWU_10235 [Marinicella sp.]